MFQNILIEADFSSSAPPKAQETRGDSIDIERNRDVAAFSYFLILSPVLLFTRKDSDFIQFHAKQATLLFAIAIIIAVCANLFIEALNYINLGIVALSLSGLIQANLGKYWRAPIIANILDSGFNADTVWTFLVRGVQTIRNVFSSSPRVTVRATSNAIAKMRGIDDNKLQAEFIDQKNALRESQKQIDFLQRELLIEKYLKKDKFSALSIEFQQQVHELKKKITEMMPGDTLEEGGPYAIRLIGEGKEILLGGYIQGTVGIFFTGTHIEGAQNFGKFCGFSIDPKNEGQVNKILEVIEKKVS